MQESEIIKVLEKVKAESKQRKFSQSYDFVVNIKDVDLKKTENQQEYFISLPKTKGKKLKVCALIGPELKEEAEKVCDKTIVVDDFTKFAQDKKAAKKLAEDYDYFIAQATVMPKIAGAFGKVFGPRGKMPNPKSGCIVPPKSPLVPLYNKLQKLVKVSLKKSPVVHALVGNEKQTNEEVAANIKTLYDAIVHHLPNEEQNIKSVYIKLTMGKPVKLK